MTAATLAHEPTIATRPEPGSEAWLAARRGGLGASEVPAIMGLDKYKSGLDIWLEKRGLAEHRPSSPQATVGRFAEPMIAEMYAAQCEVQLIEVETARHHEVQILSASADRMAVDAKRNPMCLVEIKNRGGLPQGWGDAGTDLIPESVAVQVHVQMACYQMERADVAALLGGNDFRIYTLHRNAEIEASILEYCADWWARHIVGEAEPALDGPNVADYLAKKFRSHTSEVVRVTSADPVALWLETLADAQAAKKDAEAKYERAANEVKAFVGDRYAVEGPAGKAIWTLAKDSQKVNYEQAARELYRAAGMPEAEWEQYLATFTTTKPGSRSFRFTAAIGGR